jgi:hypothetical protein
LAQRRLQKGGTGQALIVVHVGVFPPLDVQI